MAEHLVQARREPDSRDDQPKPLFDDDKIGGLRARWQHIQTGFVDDPRRAVHEADELVGAVIGELTERKGELEGQWRHGEPATEELRIALRRYRAFFDQLLPH